MSSDDKTQQAYRKWRAAEATYAGLLAPLDPDDAPTVKKGLAVELATARAKADNARDTFFRRALGK